MRFHPVHLVELFLPLADNAGRFFPPERYARLRAELIERFDGVTIFSRAPAEGEWRSEAGASRDEIVIFEVMTETLDRDWWHALRQRLERDFAQESVLIRATRSERL